jgi:hypothetical protein
MPERCFIEEGSSPPVCGVHDVALVQSIVSINANAPHLGSINCLKCLISQTVISDSK